MNVGSNQEIDALRHQIELCEKRSCARMAVVYGRRRVGKTTLILKALKDQTVPFAYCFVPRVAT